MRRTENERDAEVDEYLWPLTGDMSPINWESLTEELRIRERLAEIRTHIHEMHVRPRLRRMGPRVSSVAARAAVEAVIAGPDDGPAWVQTLKDPVPRALRDEWTELATRLREIESQRGSRTAHSR